jgi:hypothetical protein
MKRKSKVASNSALPASRKLLQLTRAELRADTRALRSDMRAGFSQVDARFSQVDARFSSIDAKLEQVISEVARIGALVEEQNSNNRVVLEGLTGLWHRQERVEGRVDDVEKFVRLIGRPKS